MREREADELALTPDIREAGIGWTVACIFFSFSVLSHMCVKGPQYTDQKEDT